MTRQGFQFAALVDNHFRQFDNVYLKKAKRLGSAIRGLQFERWSCPRRLRPAWQ